MYQPYGASSKDSNKASEKVSTYSFSGKEEDGSGLYYFEARYYDPVTTRFVSPDPLFAVDMEKCIESIIECNLYQYTGNNPVVRVDPDGLFAHIGFGAVVGGVIGFGVELGTQVASGDYKVSKLVGSTVGGALTGGLIVATGGGSLAIGGAAAVGGATGNLTTQGIDNVSSILNNEPASKLGIDIGSLAKDTILSAITGPVGAKIPLPKIPGINKGINSFLAITKSTTTKLMNGSISKVSLKTMGKAVVSETISAAPAITLKTLSDSSVQMLSNASSQPDNKATQ